MLIYVISLTIEFLHNLSFSANSWQEPDSIDIQWLQPIECQCWQDPAWNWQKILNYAKTQIKGIFNLITFNCFFFIEQIESCKLNLAPLISSALLSRKYMEVGTVP